MIQEIRIQGVDSEMIEVGEVEEEDRREIIEVIPRVIPSMGMLSHITLRQVVAVDDAISLERARLMEDRIRVIADEEIVPTKLEAESEEEGVDYLVGVAIAETCRIEILPILVEVVNEVGEEKVGEDMIERDLFQLFQGVVGQVKSVLAVEKIKLVPRRVVQQEESIRCRKRQGRFVKAYRM